MLNQSDIKTIDRIDTDMLAGREPRMADIDRLVSIARRQDRENRNLVAGLAALDGMGGVKSDRLDITELAKRIEAAHLPRGVADLPAVAQAVNALELASHIVMSIFNQDDQA